MSETIKLVITLLFVAAGVVGFYWMADQILVLRILSVLLGLAAAFAVVRTAVVGQQALAFIGDSFDEARKVVWPARKETIQTTVAVFVLVVVMALFLWIIDVGFLLMVKMLMNRGV